MAHVNMLKFPVSSPADTSPLQKLQDAGYKPDQILGIIGKTEGNGCVNDFSRTLSAHVWESLVPNTAVTIFSGGTEGVLSPHVTFILREAAPTGLVACVARTRALAAHEIGFRAHAVQVQRTVRGMMAERGLAPDDVCMVLVKCPLLTSRKIQAVRDQGGTPVSADTYESMAASRYASALGVSLSLDGDELHGADAGAEALPRGRWCARASCSAGAELDDCHILLLAHPTRGPLRAVTDVMTDAIDAASLVRLRQRVEADGGGEIVQVFAKAEADATGLIRGLRHTMNTDSDIHSTRHARAAVGGLIAGLFADTMVYVSGGAEGQGPPGGGPLCVIYRCPPE
ncbi:MAG: hypothetical protein M1818_005500 [Claussenomyces sp. TS43310]|nr:MAG: hypothetical protein M1818_005500 [Claussenomyces sp. TS43310]